MTDKLHFNLVSPERELASGEADQVDIPGTEGWIGVLPGHAPAMTTLAPGMIRIKNGAEEKRIFVRGGFAEISPAGLTVLAEEAAPAEELDAARVAQRIRDCEEDLADVDTATETRRMAERELQQLKELQSALS